ncbi:MAG: alpha/beta hydrolase [Hyphomicrobiaceae bacterium]
MYRLFGGVLALLAMCVPACAGGTIERDWLSSAALGRPFLYSVYLPDGYRMSGLKYPVLYLLHGAGGDESTWIKSGRIVETADKLIASGAMPPAVIVMPGCRACWWVDGHRDKADTAFWKELVPEIEHKFRVMSDRRGRLVAGLSAGGYGAVRFAMEHANDIAAVAALSPAIYANEPPAISSARLQPPFVNANGSFDLALWRQKNYTAYFRDYLSQPNKVAFYLFSGDDDEYGIVFETVALFKRLHEHQPDLTELRIVDGEHCGDIWTKASAGAMRYVFRFADKPVPAGRRNRPPDVDYVARRADGPEPNTPAVGAAFSGVPHL